MIADDTKLSRQDADSLRHLFAWGTATLEGALGLLGAVGAGQVIDKFVLGQLEEAVLALSKDLNDLTVGLLGIDVAHAELGGSARDLDTFSDGSSVATAELELDMDQASKGRSANPWAGRIIFTSEPDIASCNRLGIARWKITIHKPPHERPSSQRLTAWADLQSTLMPHLKSNVAKAKKRFPEAERPTCARRQSASGDTASRVPARTRKPSRRQPQTEG